MAKDKINIRDKKELKQDALSGSGSTAKKLGLTLVAVLCSLSLLAVGVVSALTSFAVSIESSFAVDISNVEGTLTASRTGGVYGEPKEGYEYDFEHKKGAPAQDFSEVIYSTSKGVTEEYTELKNTKLNLTRELNVVEYVYRFTLDEENYLNTKISLTTLTKTGWKQHTNMFILIATRLRLRAQMPFWV